MLEPAFAQNRFLGNIGAPLDPDWWNTQFDDAEDLEEEVNRDGSTNAVSTLR